MSEGISRSRFGALIKRRTGHLISDEKIGAFFAKLDVQTDEELQWCAAPRLRLCRLILVKVASRSPVFTFRLTNRHVFLR